MAKGASLQIDLPGFAPPESPVVVGAVDNILDLTGKSSVTVNIPVYTNYSPLDSLTLHFGDLLAPVSKPPRILPQGSMISVILHAYELTNGKTDVFYDAIDLAGNSSTSNVTTITVTNAEFNRRPAPDYPDYPNSVGARKKIVLDGGVRVRFPTTGLQAGDLVTLVWKGYLESGELAPEAYSEVFRRRLSQSDIAATYIESWVSMSPVLAVGPNGIGISRYVVERGQPGSETFQGASLPARLLLLEDPDFLLLSATSGVGVRKDSLPYLLPSNRLWIGASPFVDISLSIDGGALFDTDPPSPQLTVTTDVRGLACIDFYMQYTGPQNVTSKISAKLSPTISNITVNTTSTFQHSLRSSQVGVLLYCNHDFAMADGADTLRIWVRTASALATMPVSVSGSALVCGYSSDYTSMVHRDFCCTISVTSADAGTVDVSVGDINNHATFSIVFRRSPFSPG